MVDCLHNSLNSISTLPQLAFKSLLEDWAFPAALLGGLVFTKRGGASCHAKIRGLSFSKWSNGMFHLQPAFRLNIPIICFSIWGGKSVAWNYSWFKTEWRILGRLARSGFRVSPVGVWLWLDSYTENMPSSASHLLVLFSDELLPPKIRLGVWTELLPSEQLILHFLSRVHIQ